MDNNEPTIESLREEIAAKDAALAEMKAAADAQHAEAEKLGKLAEEAAAAGKAVAQEYENAKAEFAKQLAEKDAALSAADAQFAEARTRWEADTLAARKAAEDASAVVKAEFAKQLADKDAEIASLKAEAKTAEQIAAEKYGAALPAPGGVPGAVDVEALKKDWSEVRKDSGPGRQRWIRNLSDAQFKALFGQLTTDN